VNQYFYKVTAYVIKMGTWLQFTLEMSIVLPFQQHYKSYGLHPTTTTITYIYHLGLHAWNIQFVLMLIFSYPLYIVVDVGSIS